MQTSNQPLHGEALDRRFDELYEAYGKPLEADHWGEFLAVSQDGQTILGSSMDEVAHRAAEAFGHGIFLYKVGERAVGRWR